MGCARETYTIWLKSLVFHGNGCTVFDSKGQIVYRIDNYDNKRNHEVCLMDFQGRGLFTMRRKKPRVLGSWDGYKCSESRVNWKKPWFQVRRSIGNILAGDLTFQVTVGCNAGNASYYRMAKVGGKCGFKITDSENRLVAEGKQKQACSGQVLGEDVLSLLVESQIDHSLVMALVVVYQLINQKM